MDPLKVISHNVMVYKSVSKQLKENIPYLFCFHKNIIYISVDIIFLRSLSTYFLLEDFLSSLKKVSGLNTVTYRQKKGLLLHMIIPSRSYNEKLRKMFLPNSI
jgi:hypothetical protein